MTSEHRTLDRIEIYRRMTPQQRLQVGFDLCKLHRILIWLEVRHEHPEWNGNRITDEVRRKLLLEAGVDAETLGRYEEFRQK